MSQGEHSRASLDLARAFPRRRDVFGACLQQTRRKGRRRRSGFARARRRCLLTLDHQTRPRCLPDQFASSGCSTCPPRCSSRCVALIIPLDSCRGSLPELAWLGALQPASTRPPPDNARRLTLPPARQVHRPGQSPLEARPDTEIFLLSQRARLPTLYPCLLEARRCRCSSAFRRRAGWRRVPPSQLVDGREARASRRARAQLARTSIALGHDRDRRRVSDVDLRASGGRLRPGGRLRDGSG